MIVLFGKLRVLNSKVRVVLYEKFIPTFVFVGLHLFLYWLGYHILFTCRGIVKACVPFNHNIK